MQRVKQTLSLLSLLSLTVSCVKPPNFFACRELKQKLVITVDDFGIEDRILVPNPVCLKEINESRCGFCVSSISNETKYVGENQSYHLNGQPWSSINEGAVILPIESYSKLKEFVINSCKKSKDCSDDVDKWRTKFKDLEGK